jgi:hypothetical protein
MEEGDMSFTLYLVGFVVLTAGVAWALSLAGVAPTWIIVVSVILVGFGIVTGVTRTRAKDPPAP